MWKVLVYDIEADRKKYRHFNSEAEATHYATALKAAAFGTQDIPAIFIDAMPA